MRKLLFALLFIFTLSLPSFGQGGVQSATAAPTGVVSGLPAPMLSTTPTWCASGYVPASIDVAGNAVGCYALPSVIYKSTTVPYSSTVTFDSTASLNYIVLTGNVNSSTLAAGTSGQYLTLQVCQDSVGARIFTPPSNFRGTISLSIVALKCNNILLQYSTPLSSWVVQSYTVF